MVIVGFTPGNDISIKRVITRAGNGLYCSDVQALFPCLIRLPFGAERDLMAQSAFFRLLNDCLAAFVKKYEIKSLQDKIIYADFSMGTEKAIKKLKNMATRKRFKLLFVIIAPLSEKAFQKECEWIIEKCRLYGIDLIDMRKAFQKAGYSALKISDDDVCHPNKAGQQLIATEIFKHLEENKLFEVPGKT